VAPSLAPSAAAETSTTIGWNVKGTGVNGSGMLICAAMAVRTVANATAPARSAARRARASPRAATVESRVGCMRES